MAKGESMEPQINNNTLLLLASATYAELRPGMTVVYRDASGDLVAHRVIEQTPDGWVSKGLNNGSVDPQKVTAQNLQGIVFGYVHYQDGADELAVQGAKLPQVAYAKRY
jgi:signal peptidase I